MIINIFSVFCKSTQGGSTDKVHKSMKSFIGHVPGVTSELTPSGIRVSSAYQMARNLILNISGEIVRGVWSFEGESRLFYYITKILYVSQAGLGLGNHADTTKLCPMYSIDCIINNKNRINIHHYIDNLFGTNIGGEPAMFTIKTHLFESLLYWFDNFNVTYNSTKMVNKTMLRIGIKFEINLHILKELGKVVRKYLSERCVSKNMSLGDAAQGINYIQEKNFRVIEQPRDAENSNE